MKIVHRPAHTDRIERLLSRRPVVALLGARQVGKTTLARQTVSRHKGQTTVFDLEDQRGLALLEEPTLALESLRGLVVLDEIQHRLGLCHQPDEWSLDCGRGHFRSPRAWGR